jgi:peptidoglycan hydrolase CwlO-like protein
MLLSSKSFVDFLNKAEFINKMSAYDKRMLDSYVAAKEAVDAKEKALEEQKADLEEAKAAMLNEQNAVETLMADKEKEIIVYQGDIHNKEAAIAEYQAMIAEQDQIIKDLEAAILEEKKRLLAENKKAIVYDGGQFKWPAPSYTRIRMIMVTESIRYSERNSFITELIWRRRTDHPYLPLMTEKS